MPVTRDGQYHPDKTFAYWGERSVWLVAWIRADGGWWAHVRWVEPLIIDGVSQGGVNIDVCVPAAQMRRHPRVPQREYDLLKRVDARSGTRSPAQGGPGARPAESPRQPPR